MTGPTPEMSEKSETWNLNRFHDSDKGISQDKSTMKLSPPHSFRAVFFNLFWLTAPFGTKKNLAAPLPGKK